MWNTCASSAGAALPRYSERATKSAGFPRSAAADRSNFANELDDRVDADLDLDNRPPGPRPPATFRVYVLRAPNETRNRVDGTVSRDFPSGCGDLAIKVLGVCAVIVETALAIIILTMLVTIRLLSIKLYRR